MDPKKSRGHFKDHEDKERIWICGVSSCRKVLPELDEQGQSDAKVWAELVAEYGMEGAKAVADDLAAM